MDEEADEIISRIRLEEGNTEFWKRRFLAEGLYDNAEKTLDGDELEAVDDELADELDDDAVDVEAKDVEDDEEADEEEEEVDQTETEVADVQRVKEKEAEAKKKPLQMIGVQLLKDSGHVTTKSKRSRRNISRMVEV